MKVQLSVDSFEDSLWYLCLVIKYFCEVGSSSMVELVCWIVTADAGVKLDRHDIIQPTDRLELRNSHRMLIRPTVSASPGQRLQLVHTMLGTNPSRPNNPVPTERRAASAEHRSISEGIFKSRSLYLLLVLAG